MSDSLSSDVCFHIKSSSEVCAWSGWRSSWSGDGYRQSRYVRPNVAWSGWVNGRVAQHGSGWLRLDHHGSVQFRLGQRGSS